MIIIKSHKCSIDRLKNDYPGAVIIDVTSHAKDEFIRLSPFYPVGGIPVPYSKGWYATCVESVWQGLKDFKSVGTDYSLFKNTTMKNLKRTTRRFGELKGHRKGVNGKELLGYIDARKFIYLPTYRWVLENKVSSEVERIREISRYKTVILLDYATNPDVENAYSPLSHAALIKAYIEGNYPHYEDAENSEVVHEAIRETGCDFRVGQLVRHPSFGRGSVKTMEGDRIRVVFEMVGEKLLSLRFAKLQFV